MHQQTKHGTFLVVLAAALAAVVAVSAGAQRLAAAPTIAGFAPTHALVGAVVTINGQNLAGAQVQFNGMAATNVSVNAAGTTIRATIDPETTDGPAPIGVITPGGTATSTQDFTVDPPTGANPQTGKATKMTPVIKSLAPTRAEVGKKVTIKGANFGGAMSVKFAGVKAIFKVPNAKEIIATVPKKARSGLITIKTSIGTASLHFTVAS
jgi:hypothetical protein